MTIFRISHQTIYRYGKVCDLQKDLRGSIRISTLKYCRNAENEFARDAQEGIKTTTSLPGRNSLNASDLAMLLDLNPNSIQVKGNNAVVTNGENAIRRSENIQNAFVFCTSAIENDQFLRSRFGGGCIRIRDAHEFFQLIDKSLRKAVAPYTLCECIVDDVEYAPRVNNYRKQTSKCGAFIKPSGGESSFEKEQEVRGIWIPQGLEAEPIILDVPEVIRLLELLK